MEKHGDLVFIQCLPKLSFLNFTVNVLLFGPSLSVICPDFLWYLSSEFFKLFINRANLQKCSPASETWKIWPISLKGMKPSFGFCYIYSPGLGTKWSLRKDIKTVFKWGPPKQSKVLVTSHKIYKQLIIPVNRQSGNWVLNFYILVIEYLLCIG